MGHNAAMPSVAIGDPQAPFERFLAILARHGLLGDDGRLADDVHLVSMGDHFDYGRAPERERAAADGLALLEWLAAHPPERVTLLLGNHDLARVCELAPFTDASFAAAHREARALYDADADATEFLARYPHVPDAECLARDYSCFVAAQRELVTELLREGRFRLAADHRGLLLVHAGVTVDDLGALGIAATDARTVADGLNRFLSERVGRWTGGALDLSPFHQVGSAAMGEGRGALYHRPCDPSTQPASRLVGPPRRRFDPRTLPSAFPQAIGHIRDNKCRELMPHWSVDEPTGDGPLRSLIVGPDATRYQPGCDSEARLFFLDGGMAHANIETYQLFDLDRRAAFTR